jgi:protein-S-isoprenylcysteine O-methyltransferase Ste14
MDDEVILALLWIGWCAVHSGLIARPVTEGLRLRLGDGFRYYRLAYNLVAVVTLLPVYLYGRSLPSETLFRWEGGLRLLQGFLLLTSALLFVAGARHYSLRQLLGLRQAETGRTHATLTECGRLHTTGILEVTRHPWYLGALLLLWTTDVSVASLIWKLILSFYLVLGTILEERRLVREFGDEYRDYQARVSMLVPVKWAISRARRFTR